MLRTVVERPLPPEADEVEEEDRPQLEWWKCKKWAIHILGRFYDRYASPQNIEKCYTAFSDYYLKTFSGVCVCVCVCVGGWVGGWVGGLCMGSVVPSTNQLYYQENRTDRWFQMCWYAMRRYCVFLKMKVLMEAPCNALRIDV